MFPETSHGKAWSEKDWETLVYDIRDRKVIPIVGEELYTVPGPNLTADPLYRVVAERFAEYLKVKAPPTGGQPRTLNEVVCAYLREEKVSSREAEMESLYGKFCKVFRDLKPQPSNSLISIASIADFLLLLTTTPDDLLEKAIDQKRFGGLAGTMVLGFALSEILEDLRNPYDPERARPGQPPVVFHLFGRLSARPNQFVLSDDDLLEFFLALEGLKSDQLVNLRDALEDYHLLFLGGTLSDWLVRFLLRTANRRRLSEKKHYDVLVAAGMTPDSELLKFLTFFSPRTKLAACDPNAFVEELHRRWSLGAEEVAPVLPVVEPAREMPRDCVFISYATEDLEPVRTLKAHLDAAGVPVWFDREQLMAGKDWDHEIRRNVSGCSLFLPVISRNTQRIQLNAYFRSEWNQAEEVAKASHSEVEFVIPILLEEIPGTLAVPDVFLKKQATMAPQGVPSPALVQRLKQLYQHRMANPIRR